VDTPPSGLLGELAGLLDANVAVCNEVDVQAVCVVKLKDTQPAEIGSSSAKEGKEVVPELPSLLDGEEVRESEDPYIRLCAVLSG